MIIIVLWLLLLLIVMSVMYMCILTSPHRAVWHKLGRCRGYSLEISHVK